MKRIHRRHVLRGLCGVAIGLPLLEAMGCATQGEAERRRVGEARHALGSAKRFIAVMNNNGRVPGDFFPSGTEKSFTLGPIMDALAPHQDDLLIFKGIDNDTCSTGPTDGHREGVASMLTGWGLSGTDTFTDANARGMSVDHRIMQVLAPDVKRPKLGLSTEGSGILSSLSYDEFLQNLPNEISPNDLFEKLFADASLSKEEIEKRIARRLSILDGVKDDYDALLPRLGKADAQRLDAHLTSIREVEKGLAIVNQCDPGTLSIEEGDTYDELPQRVRSLMDLGVLALACDVSRVLTMTYRHPGGGISYHPWLDLGEVQSDPLVNEHHEMSHEQDNYRDELLSISRWYMEQTAYLVQRLKDTPDGPAGSLFDSVVLMHGSDIADGHHTHNDMPYFLIGSGGGYFQTGRYLQFDHAPHNDLLVSILHAFGVDDASFGDPDFCNGPLPGLTA
jgi:hypothetical protein